MLTYRNPIAVAAHRGNSRYFPENTMAAFRSAVELQPDMIEMDVHMTSDGVLICMHDHMVDRTLTAKASSVKRRLRRCRRWMRAAGRAKPSVVKRCRLLWSFWTSCAIIPIFCSMWS